LGVQDLLALVDFIDQQGWSTWRGIALGEPTLMPIRIGRQTIAEKMDFLCVRGHIGLFLIFWMSLSKRPSTSSAQEMQALNKASTI